MSRAARRRLGRRDEGRRAPTRRSASRWRPPTRSTCSTPPARPASRRASSATTAGTRSRWPGRCRTSTTCTPGQVWWTASDVGWVVGHSYIVYAPLITGATTVLYEGKPVGTPDAGAFWRVIAEHGVEALFTAPTAIRAIKKEDPDGGLAGRPRPQPLPHAVPGRGAARPRHLPLGHRAARASRWSTTGGRPRPAGRSRANLRGLDPMPIKPGSPIRAGARATTSQVLDEHGDAGGGRARRARSASGCRCRPARCRRCGGTTSGIVVVVPLGVRRLLPLRRRRVRRRGRLPVRHGPHRRRHQRGRAPALDRLDGGGARRAPGRRGVRGDRRRRPLKGQVPRGFVVLKAGVDRRPGRGRARAGRPGARRDRRGRGVPDVAVVGGLPKTRAARSCARRCARSPTARTPPCPRRSRTRRCSTRLRRHAAPRTDEPGAASVAEQGGHQPWRSGSGGR